MESPPTPMRLPQSSDRRDPERTPDAVRLPSPAKYHGDPRIAFSVLPEQRAPIHRQEMSRKSAEDISERIRQDGVRHLLTGRATGHSEYSYGGNAFARSFIVGAGSARTKDVP